MIKALIPLSLESSSLYTGTQSLLNDLSGLLLIILPIVAVIAVIYCAIRRMMAS